MQRNVIVGKRQAPFVNVAIEKRPSGDIARLRSVFSLSGGHPPRLSRPRRAETRALQLCDAGTKSGVSGLDSLPPEKCLPSGC